MGEDMDLQAISDRLELETLAGEFTDAVMLRDWDRAAAMFTVDGVWAIPDVGVRIGRRHLLSKPTTSSVVRTSPYDR